MGEIPEPLRLKTFETFDMWLPDGSEYAQELKETRDAAVTFAAGESEYPWLFLMDAVPGTGKTHLAAAIANSRAALWIHVPEWFRWLRARFDGGEHDAPIGAFQKADCLVIDDLDYAGYLPDDTIDAWANEQLFRVLDYRYMYQLPTVITGLNGGKCLGVAVRALAAGVAEVPIWNIPSYREHGHAR